MNNRINYKKHTDTELLSMNCYDTLHENHQLEKKNKKQISSAGKEAEIFLKICAYVSPTSDTAPGRG